MTTARALGVLDEAVAQTLAVQRLFAIAFEVVAVAGGHAWYLSPARLVAPLAAAVWGAVFAATCLRRGLTRTAVAVDLAAALAFAATASRSVPPEAVDGGPHWLLMSLIGTLLALVWCAPARVWSAAAAAIGAAFAASHLSAGVPVGRIAVAVGLMAGSTVLAAAAARVLRRGAVAADAALERAARRWSIQAAATARNRHLRDGERVLHETALNTLTGLGWGASGYPTEVIRDRCRRSADACSRLLARQGGSGAGLASQLDELVEQAGRDGLVVELSKAGRPDVPAEVGGVLAATVREALSNVRDHSGTRRARLGVSARGGEVSIVVRDDGVGFDPPAGGSGRFGLPQSVLRRIADVGGSAEVTSAPGAGTAVALGWSPRPEPDPAVCAEIAMLKRSYARDVVRAVGVGALLWQTGLGILLIAGIGHYRAPLVVLATWAVCLVALARCIDAMTGDARARPRRRAAAVAAAVAAVLGLQLAAGLLARGADPPPQPWVLLAAAGLACLLAVGRPAREWVPATVLTAGTAVAVVGWRQGLDPDGLARLGCALYALVALQVSLSMFVRARNATAGVTVRAARAEVDLAAQRAAAIAVRRDRRMRLSRLADGPLPLLAGIGDGRLDPCDPAVRRRAASCAASLRRALTRQLAPAALTSALEGAVRVAERRGVRVEVQVAGDVGGMPRPVENEVVRAVGGILAGIAGGRVMLTVIGDARDGSLIAAFASRDAARAPDAPGRQPAGGRWTEVVAETEDGQVCVEVRWGASRRADVPA
jgi:signal transduction histidine kinase